MITNGHPEPFNPCAWFSQLSGSKKAAISIFIGIAILGMCLFSSDLPLIWKFAITGFFLVLLGLLRTAFIDTHRR